jgi:CheY-like chemotaxis protein
MLSLGRGETVLVVESEREQLLRDEEMLAALGYEPVGFEHSDEAIAACHLAPDRFDIILVSHASPGGLDLAHTLHGVAPQKPMLLATASTIDVSVDALAEAGISQVLAGRWTAPYSPRCWRAASFIRHVTTVTRLPEAEILL